MKSIYYSNNALLLATRITTEKELYLMHPQWMTIAATVLIVKAETRNPV
jgi:hypothetical protein